MRACVKALPAARALPPYIRGRARGGVLNRPRVAWDGPGLSGNGGSLCALAGPANQGKVVEVCHKLINTRTHARGGACYLGDHPIRLISSATLKEVFTCERVLSCWSLHSSAGWKLVRLPQLNLVSRSFDGRHNSPGSSIFFFSTFFLGN